MGATIVSLLAEEASESLRLNCDGDGADGFAGPGGPEDKSGMRVAPVAATDTRGIPPALASTGILALLAVGGGWDEGKCEMFPGPVLPESPGVIVEEEGPP